MDCKIFIPVKNILDAANDGSLEKQGDNPFRDICDQILPQTKGDKNPLDLTQRFVRVGLRLQTLTIYEENVGEPSPGTQLLLHNSRHTGTGLVYSVSFSYRLRPDSGATIYAEIIITSENTDNGFKMKFLTRFVEDQPLYISWGGRGKDFVHKSLVKMMDPNGTGFRMFLPPQADEINGLGTDEEKLERLNAI